MNRPAESRQEAEAAEWFCRAVSRYGYQCTLAKGHDGAHLAEGVDRLCDAWVPGERTVVLSGGPHDGREVADPGPAVFFNSPEGVHCYLGDGVYVGIRGRRSWWRRLCDWWDAA